MSKVTNKKNPINYDWWKEDEENSQETTEIPESVVVDMPKEEAKDDTSTVSPPSYKRPIHETVVEENPDKELLERMQMSADLSKFATGLQWDSIHNTLRNAGVNPVSAKIAEDRLKGDKEVGDYLTQIGMPVDEEGYLDMNYKPTEKGWGKKIYDEYIKKGYLEAERDANGNIVNLRRNREASVAPLIEEAVRNTPLPKSFTAGSQSKYFSDITQSVIAQMPKDENGRILYNGQYFPFEEVYTGLYPAIAQKVHEDMLDSNKEYFDANFLRATGQTYEDWYRDFASKRVDEMEVRIGELRDAVAADAEKVAYAKGREVAMSSATLVPASVLGWASGKGAAAESKKMFDDALEEINNFRKNNFGSGFQESFDTLGFLTFGLADLGSTYTQMQLLEKARRGDTLSDTEKNVLELLNILQEFATIKENLGWEASLGSKIGGGVGATVEMLGPFGGAMMGTSMVGNVVKLSTGVAKGAFKANVKAVGKNILNNTLVGYMRGAIAAPLMPNTYAEYTKALKSQYKFNEDGSISFTPTNKRLAYMSAYIDGMNEIASEVYGSTIGELIGYGARTFGRVAKLNKVVDALYTPVSKKVDDVLSKVGDTPKAMAFRRAVSNFVDPMKGLDPETRELLRVAGVQDGIFAEATSEVAGDFMATVMKDMVGAEVNYDDYHDKDFWLMQLAVAGLYGGTMSTIGKAGEAVSTYDYIAGVGEQNRRIIDSIESAELRDMLLAITADGNIDRAYIKLAGIDWSAYHPTDKDKAASFVRGSYALHAAMGSVQEDTRAKAFAVEAQKLTSNAYRGKDGYAPVSNDPSLIEVESEGRKYYVISGVPADKSDTSMLTCMDMETGEQKAILAAKANVTSIKGVNEVLQQRYNEMFSAQVEAERIESIKSAYGQMERPTAEIAKSLMAQCGIIPPKEGDVVTLADGRSVEVMQDLEDGTYVVRLQDKVPLLFTVPFYNLKSNDTLTAAAQELMLEGKVENATREAVEVAEKAVENGAEVATTETPSAQSNAVERRLSIKETEEASEAQTTMEAQETEVANAVEDMENIPTTEDGEVDYDAIKSPKTFAKTYVKEAGSVKQAHTEVKEMRAAAEQELQKIVERGGKEYTASKKRAAAREQRAIQERIAFYDAVAREMELLETKTEAEFSNIIENEYSVQVSAPVKKVVDGLAKELGLKVRFVEDAAGQNAYILGNEVVISHKNRQKSIAFLIGHEYTHRMQDASPKQYAKFKSMVREAIGEERWNSLVENLKKEYEKQGKSITDTQLEDEVTADAAGELVENRDVFIEHLQHKASDVGFLGFLRMIFRGLANTLRRIGATDREKTILDIVSQLDYLIDSAARNVAKVSAESDARYSARVTPEMDAEYLEAVEKGDMDTAQRMVMEAAEKAGYINDESWRMNHRAPRKDEENANPFNTEKIVPEDFWEHPEWYTNIRHSSETRESYYAMKPAIDKYKRLMAEGKTDEAENVTITLYRGVDKTANKREASFRNGDWITPSRSYALLSVPYGKARVISQEVKLKDIWWDGNSINEWGYDDGANYGYRDTKNNRKLLDPVTYDDAGNVIPLSERFNPRKEDIRYSMMSSIRALNDALIDYYDTHDIEGLLSDIQEINEKLALNHPYLANTILDYVEDGNAENVVERIKYLVDGFDEGYEYTTGEDIRYSLMQPTDEEVTFDNFFLNTSAIFTHTNEVPKATPDFVSKSGSRYWYGEDERGKYVIRQSDHWSVDMRDEDTIEKFNDNPREYNNIASCFWGIDMRGYQPQKYETINSENVKFVDYISNLHRLRIIFNNGRYTDRYVAPIDMRPYYTMRNEGKSMAEMNAYVVDMVNEKYNVKPIPRKLTAKAYLDEFTKWEDASASAPTAETQTLTTANGDMVANVNEATGQGRFSLRTYREGGRDVLTGFLATRVSDGALTEAEAQDMVQQMDDIYAFCETMKDHYAPFGQWSEAKVVEGEDGKPALSVIKANGDYAMNLDFSLVCKKRRTLDAVLNEMVKRGMIKGMSQKDTTIAKINEVIRKYGFETACALCFVDARRFQVLKTARAFCDLYNGVVNLLVPKKKNIPINEFNFAGRSDATAVENGLETMSDDALNIEAVRKIGYQVVGKKKDGSDMYPKTVIAKIARHLVEHPEDRRYVSPSDFVSTAGFDKVKATKPAIMSLYNSKKGTGGPKAAYSDVQYLNDIIKADWDADAAYAVGGVRVQSFSDYVPRMVFDYIQMVAELAAKKLPAHAYTKEHLFAKTFGLTGMKINLSLVPDVVADGIAAGLDANGNYVWKTNETFPYEDAVALQEAEGYRDNCGTIAVGVSDAHILKMLDDPNIRMVIPYHKSGLPKQVAKMNNVATFTDYTNVQNTTRNGIALSKEDAKNVPNYNELLREHKDARKAAQAYVDWCTERGYTPKFAKFATHPNYYKLLEDFTTMVDGNYVPQSAMTFTFPTEESAFGSLETLIEQGLEEDAVLEGMRDVKVDAIVEEVGEVLGVQPKFSLIGEKGAAKIFEDDTYGSPAVDLEVAREMEAEGKDALSIRLATGWERGADDKWRYEIMDGEYHHPADMSQPVRLSDILDNPALYEAYPDLADMKVEYKPLDENSNGYYDGRGIVINSEKGQAQNASTLIHEIQHAIQHREGFAQGGNSKSFEEGLDEIEEKLTVLKGDFDNLIRSGKGEHLLRRLYIATKALGKMLQINYLNAKKDVIEYDAYQRYRKLAGEVEARNVQARHAMSRHERAWTPIGETEDVARESQEFVYRTAASSSDVPRYSVRREDVARKDQEMLFDEYNASAADARYSIIHDMTEEDAYQASLLEEAMRMEREATSNGMDITQEIADRTGWVHLADGTWKYYGEGKLDITDKSSAERAAFRWLESKKAVKVEQVKKTYAPLIKSAENNEVKTQLEFERDTALAQIEAEYKEIFEDFDNNPDTYVREHQEAESYNANLDMYVGSLTKARKEVERLERNAKKRKLSDEEKMAAMRAVKSAVAKELRDGLGRYTRKYDIQRMMDAVSDARTPYAMLKAIDKAMESLFEIKWRRECARMQMLTKSKISYGVTAIDASSFLNTFVSDHKITAADARKIMNDYWRGTKANGVSVAKYIDDTTRQAMEFISEMAEYTEARARFSDIEATEIIAFTRKLREKLEDYTSLNDYKLKTALANDAVRKAVIDAVDILEMYWKAQELQLSLNDDKHRRDISALEIKAKEITAQLREVNQQIKDLADGKVVVTPSGVKDRDLLRKELQERYNTLLAEREEAYAEMYNAMPDIINLMQDANRAVETLLRTGKVNLAAERTKRKEHEKELIDDVLADLASPASPQKHHIDLRDKSIFERIATVIGSFIGAPLGSMDYMLRAIGRNAPMGEGRTYNRFAYAFQKAYDNIYTALEARKKMLDDKCNILWGENYHEVHKMAESTKVMTLTYSSAINTKGGEWKPVENTTDIYVTQAMYILAMWNQAEGRVTLERQGFTDESINAMRDALNRIDPRWIEFADWVVEEYLPLGRERYNAVHRDIFGTSMAAVPNYFPIKRAKEKLHKEEDVAKGDVDLLPSTVVGAIKERTSNVVPIDIETSFFEALNENTSVMEAWAEMAGLIQDINTILSNGAVKTTMLDINDTLFSDFKKAAQVATLGYIGKTPDIDKKVGTILNRLWAGSKIAFRLNTAFKQLSSALLFAGYSTDPKFQATLLWRYLGGVGKMPVALMNGIIEGASHLTGHSLTNIDIMTNIEWAKANMPSFAKRWNEGVAGYDLMARTTSGNTSWKQRAWYVKFDDAVRAVTKFGMKPNAFIDAFTSAAGARAVYDYTYKEMRKEGYSEEGAHTLAIINAEMAFNTTQQSSEGLYLAPMQVDRSIVATTLSTFMNAPYAMFRNTMIGVKEIFKDAKKELAEIEKLEFKRAMDVAKKQVETQVAAAVARGEYSEEEAKKRRNELFDSAKAKIIPLVKDRAYNKYVKAQTKAVVMVFLNGYAGQVAFNLMGKLAEFMFGDDDEEKKKMLYDIAVKSAWEAPVSMMPIGGYITSMTNGYSASFFPAMDELSKEISTIVKGLREEDISPEVIYAATTMCMRWGLGLSVDTIANIALGIENMFEDGMSAEAILKVMNAPEGQIRKIIGQRRNDESEKEYIERIMRFYSIAENPMFSAYPDAGKYYEGYEIEGKGINYFDYHGGSPKGMTDRDMQRIDYEKAYRRNIVLRYGGGKEYARHQEIDEKFNEYAKTIGSPNDVYWRGYYEPKMENLGEKEWSDLMTLKAEVNGYEKWLQHFTGSDESYYEVVKEVEGMKQKFNETYEQFK